jgi:hypothetical protein
MIVSVKIRATQVSGSHGKVNKYTIFVFLYVIAFTAFSSALSIFCRVSQISIT